MRHLPIQHNGRVKPLESFAREALRLMTGKERIDHADPVETVLGIIAEPEGWQAKPLIAVPFVPLREALGIDRHATHISYTELVATRKLMRRLPPIVQKQQNDEKLSMLEQETLDAFERFVAFSNLVDQRLALVPPASSGGNEWVSIGESQTEFRLAWANVLVAVRRSDATAVDQATARFAEIVQQANPAAIPAAWRLRLEVGYHRLAPFRAARLMYLVAFLGLLGGLFAGRRVARRVGFVALGTAFLIHAAGIVIRVIVGGRPPVSNFYETMLWLPFVGALIALIFERVHRAGYFGLAASALAAITLWLTDYVPLDPSISPVVAVLRSNLWLTVHVLTIVASYGALALATVLAHVYGGVSLASQGRHVSLASLDLFLYRAIQVGVVLLAGGVMLGAVWANASWGRYWGWDPKETWALITLLWFLAILHGRMAGWLTGVRVALATIAGFFLLLMTYYGVSFYLVGLHSYAGGHAKPLPPLLVGYLAAELAFLGAVGWVNFFRPPASHK